MVKQNDDNNLNSGSASTSDSFLKWATTNDDYDYVFCLYEGVDGDIYPCCFW